MKNQDSGSDMDTSAWRTSIAKQARAPLDKVNDLLERARIRPSPISATPSHLTITRIAFSGEKIGTEPPARDGPFQFVWDGLDTGAWVMMTDRNLKGKSSVIEIVKWLLRGEPPSSLQKDVRSWLKQASMDFRLGGKDFGVEFACSGDHFEGRLIHKNRPRNSNYEQFSSQAEFRDIMSAFFMQTLDLDIVQAFRSNSEKLATHDWPSLSSTLFIGIDYSVLLGDIFLDGLAGKLLLMYLGLPWISTLSTAQATLKLAERDQTKRANQTTEERGRREERIHQVSKDLDANKQRLQNTPSDENTRRAHQTAIAQLARISNESRVLEAKKTGLSRSLDEAFEAFNEDRRVQIRFDEGEAAQVVFRALDPEVCPRCDGHIGEERRQREKETHGCSVCGEQITEGDSDMETIRQMIYGQVNASRQAYEQTRAAVEKVEERLGILKIEAKAINPECDRLGHILDNGFDDYHDLRAEIRILEKELASLMASSEGADQPENQDLAILKATVKITEKQVEGLKHKLLGKVSQEIVRLARKFGMTAISDATLLGNATLKVIKGGQETTYSDLTGGEKLRLKVATILAMLSVSEQMGVGRHPGLLFIDSPKNQQIIDDDFEHLLNGLGSAVQTLPHLQIFVASTFSTAIQQWIGSEAKRIKHARGEEYLW